MVFLGPRFGSGAKKIEAYFRRGLFPKPLMLFMLLLLLLLLVF